MAKAQTQSNNSRSTARSAAQGTETGGRRPAAPTTEGTDAAAAVEAGPSAASQMAVIVICDNPKRKGSIAFDHFAKYGKKGVLSNLEDVRKAGVRGKDVSWDRDRFHILTGDSATEFAAIEGRDEQRTYLSGLGVPDASLIKWGYMDAPVPVEAPVEPAKTDA